MSVKEINLEKELRTLHASYLNTIKGEITTNSLDKYFDYAKSEKTFSQNNWIITFPYNFYYTTEKTSLIEISKLAVTNALLGIYYFKEDNIVDEYHAQPEQFKKYVMEFLNARILKNLSIGQFLTIHKLQNRVKFYTYLYQTEKTYYEALIWEKEKKGINLNNYLEYHNLKYLGNKALPICIPFYSFCLEHSIIDKIEACEKLIINYHIAHQLLDDLTDINKDIYKPDLSYFLNVLKIYLKDKDLTLSLVQKTIEINDLDFIILKEIKYYLNIAKTAAKTLNFKIFQNDLNRISAGVESYKRKNNAK